MVGYKTSRRMLNRWVVHSVAICSLLFGMSVGNAAPFESALPEDAILLVNVANVSELKSEVAKTRWFQLYRDPAMQPFVEKFLEGLDQTLERIEQKTGVDLAELVMLPTGQITASVRLAANPQDPPFVYFLADVKGNEKTVEGLLAQLGDRLEKDSLTKRVENGITVYAKEDAKQREQLCYTLKNGVLAMGNDPESLAKTLSNTVNGNAGSIATNERFQAFREQVGGKSNVEFFLDLNAIIGIAAEQGGQPAAAGVAMLGLNSFQSAGLSMSFNQGDFDSVMKAVLLSRGQSTLFNLFHMPAKAIQPEPWVPANINNYTSFNWDLDLFYSTLSGIVNATNPGMMAQVEQLLAGPDPDNPLLNIKADLIKPLGNRLSFVSDVATIRNSPVTRTLLAWQLDDSDRLKSLFERVLALSGGQLPIEKKVVKGDTVYLFPLGDLLQNQMPNQEEIPVGMVGFTITKTHMFLATHVELLDRILGDNAAESLASTDGYKRVASKFPARTSMISFMRGEEQARAGYEMVKSGQFSKLLQKSSEQNQEVAEILEPLLKSMDGASLPSFDVIKKYMGDAGGFGLMDESGVHFTQFSLK